MGKIIAPGPLVLGTIHIILMFFSDFSPIDNSRESFTDLASAMGQQWVTEQNQNQITDASC